MKLSALWLLLGTGILCASQTLTLDQKQSLQTYNRKPSQKDTVEQRMKTFANITKSEALNIAKKHCQTPKANAILSLHDTYLFYHIQGNSCDLYINALDGTLISRERLYE